MQILLALLFGAVVGAVVHLTLSGRETRGVALTPIAGAVIGGAVWLALTWAHLTVDNPWLWIASFAAPFILYPIIAVLTASRRHHDHAERARLRLA
jgi:uncharacterized membrane protein YeaQ/YmgE (transglycosylase-associated protein family)